MLLSEELTVYDSLSITMTVPEMLLETMIETHHSVTCRLCTVIAQFKSFGENA